MTATHTSKSKKTNGVSNGALAMADNPEAFDASLPMPVVEKPVTKPAIDIAGIEAKRDQLLSEKAQIENALAGFANSTKQYQDALARTEGALFVLNDMLKGASAS